VRGIRRTGPGPPRGGEVRIIEFICVRHGQTAWNAARRFQGQTDVPLDEHGRAQARNLGEYLRKYEIAHAFTSDLSRARDTAAAIVADRDVPLIEEPRLREMRFGDWEGLDWSQIRERHPHLPEGGWSDVRTYVPAGGETLDELNARIAAALGEIRGRVKSGERALIVTHAGVLHSLMHVLAPSGIPPMRIRFAPASITRIRFEDGRTELVSFNEHPIVVPSRR
jgi:probable phosphoglycerate mutase